jgi:hypothetical protein
VNACCGGDYGYFTTLLAIARYVNLNTEAKEEKQKSLLNVTLLFLHSKQEFGSFQEWRNQDPSNGFTSHQDNKSRSLEDMQFGKSLGSSHERLVLSILFPSARVVCLLIYI